MAKREALRQKLKAADRRRQRRQSDVSAEPAPKTGAPPSAVDVTGLLVNTILQHASSLGSEARDIIVLAALKAVFRGTTPQGENARRLADQLQGIPAQPGVSMRAFRNSVQELLDAANSNQAPQRRDAFLSYLEMLAE